MDTQWKEFSGDHARIPIGLGDMPALTGDREWFIRRDDRVFHFVGATSAEQAAATAMNNALIAHGYKAADQGLYRAFQSQEGLTPDGFPGTLTMQYLKDVLFSMGVEIAPVKIYPWTAAGGYDGVNAPTQVEWYGGNGQTLPVIVVPGTPSTSTTTTSSSTTIFGMPQWAAWTLGAVVVGGLALVLLGGKGHRGARGPRGHVGHRARHAHENALTERPRRRRRVKRKSRRRSRRRR